MAALLCHINCRNYYYYYYSCPQTDSLPAFHPSPRRKSPQQSPAFHPLDPRKTRNPQPRVLPATFLSVELLYYSQLSIHSSILPYVHSFIYSFTHPSIIYPSIDLSSHPSTTPYIHRSSHLGGAVFGPSKRPV